jgi:hypothetical protein
MADFTAIIIANDVVKMPFVLEFQIFSVLLGLFDRGENNSGHWLKVFG